YHQVEEDEHRYRERREQPVAPIRFPPPEQRPDPAAPRPDAQDRRDQQELAHRILPDFPGGEAALLEPGDALIGERLPSVPSVPHDRGGEGEKRDDDGEPRLLSPEPETLVGAEQQKSEDAEPEEDGVILGVHRQAEEQPRRQPPARGIYRESVGERPD